MTARHANDAECWRVEAERWRGEAKRLVAENGALRARVAELEGQVAALSEKVATLAKLVFGRSSEKNKPATSPDDDHRAERAYRRRRGQQPASRGHGRRDYSHLETVEEVHDVPEGERVCPDCGAPYVPFGEETSEQIDWQVRIVHRRPTYRRTCPSWNRPGFSGGSIAWKFERGWSHVRQEASSPAPVPAGAA